jgi:hypothetical protein
LCQCGKIVGQRKLPLYSCVSLGSWKANNKWCQSVYVRSWCMSMCPFSIGEAIHVGGMQGEVSGNKWSSADVNSLSSTKYAETQLCVKIAARVPDCTQQSESSSMHTSAQYTHDCPNAIAAPDAQLERQWLYMPAGHRFKRSRLLSSCKSHQPLSCNDNVLASSAK